MMRATLLTILLFFPGPGRGDGLRPPAGAYEEREGTATVSLGFGSVSFPAGAARRPAPEAALPAGPKLACNRGTFSLRYELERSAGRVRARRVSVTVRNRAEYFGEETALLREHESGHRRINEAAARRIETSLSGYATAGAGLKRAERGLKEKFREDLRAVEALHKEWDDNHVLITAPGP